jgi:DNA polymerase-3 subunit gamma/tau
MAHLSLYRRWRPRALSRITGQDPVVRTLERAIETDRVAHAYLLAAPRGTGKTSMAPVLAMGLTCAGGPTPEPCGECDSCRAIQNSSSMNVVEMDAASNRGIDEVRELRDSVNLAPSGGRVKVYVIDEVHMLTTEAFNALLKILEEPPSHVIFVLATTEAHRVLPTIVSRCQRFDFRRPGVKTLVEKLREVSDAEGIDVEDGALTVIARRAEGSFRDAEGLLEQLQSFSGGRISAEMVRELLGSVGFEVMVETTGALHERRAADALRVVDRISGEGRDPGQFAGELLDHLRRLMLLPYAPDMALSDVGDSEREMLEEQSQMVGSAEATRMIEALGDALSAVKRGADPRMELEITLLKLVREPSPGDTSLLERIEALEARVDNSTLAEVAPPTVQSDEKEEPVHPDAEYGGDEPAAEAVEEDEGPSEHAVREGASGEAQDIAGQWSSIIRELKERRQALTAAVFEEARVEGLDGSVLRLSFPEEKDFHVKMAGDKKHAGILEEALEGRLGFRPRLEFGVSGGEDFTPAPEAMGESQEEVPSTPEQPAEVDPGKEDQGGDDIIQSSQEVFEMARRTFGGEGDGGR